MNLDMPVRDRIVLHLSMISRNDPEGLVGVRTTVEISEKFGIGRDATRYHLERLVDENKVECIGKMLGEPGNPVGWKIAS